MKALVWTAVGKMEIKDVPKPIPQPGWVIMRVKYTGVCGSDIGGFLGKNELRRPPLIMGHEFTGIVEEAGPGVPREYVGKLFTVNPIIGCGHCRYCRSGLKNLCLMRKIIGIDYPGAYAEYVAVPADNLYPVSDPVKGALAEPLATSLRAVRLSGVSLGDSVLVIGAGPVGSLAIKLLNAGGIKDITAVDINAHRLEWARRWGASRTLNATGEEALKVIKELYPEGVDAVIDAVGSVDTRRLAINTVRRGGRVVFVGLHDNEVSIPGNLIVRSEIEIKGSFSYTDEDFRRAVNIIESGLLDPREGWVDVRPLERGQETFTELAGAETRYVKVMLTPGE
ncbi:galactitol-1-phosphate 5-dehydrogenase [Caldivirga sp.]|uniref:galactitol-1-phosphate 5-dehydrogenase n=1 Tax=Caldivirga sp. TaxID=2080243 RepID=UPI003D0B4C08